MLTPHVGLVTHLCALVVWFPSPWDDVDCLFVAHNYIRNFQLTSFHADSVALAIAIQHITALCYDVLC